MRFTTAYYLLIIYISVMFRPFVPIVKDVISHTFFETIHIATVHALYGSDHVQKEVSENNTDTQNNKHHTGGINEESQVQVHVSAYKYLQHVFIKESGVKSFAFCLRKAEPGFASTYSPPPDHC